MSPTTIKNFRGFGKELVSIRIIIGTFFYFTGLLFRGELSLKLYPRVLKRLLFFLKKMKHNKFVKINGRIKINLYVPGFPSKAFFTACKKVMVFDRKMPAITTLVSITSACKYHCPHCYQKFDIGKDADIDTLVKVVNKLQNKGVAFFNIEGGEPFLVFDRLKKVCDAIDDRSEILINSTGCGMTETNIMQLSKQNNLLGIMFSLHTPEAHMQNKFMGVPDAWDNLKRGIELCHQFGVPVTFNTCLRKQSFYDGDFEKVIQIATEYKGAILQLIKPKPAGGWLENSPEKFMESDISYLLSKVDQYNHAVKHKNDISISAMIREESEEVFGCTAGATDRFYINAKGDLQPCEFLNISFGNIHTDDFDTIYEEMRKTFSVPGTTLLCEELSKEIFKIKVENKLKSLPLNKELSKQILNKIKPSSKTRFYERLESL